MNKSTNGVFLSITNALNISSIWFNEIGFWMNILFGCDKQTTYVLITEGDFCSVFYTLLIFCEKFNIIQMLN